MAVRQGFLPLLLLLFACARREGAHTSDGSAPPKTVPPPAASKSEALPALRVTGEVVFSGMCDASAAVPLEGGLFAVADDEDNVLRVYDSARGGAPLGQADVSLRLHLTPKKPKNALPKKVPKPPETDIEAATRIGDLAFWLTSHGRNSSGKLKTERQRLFATSLPERGGELDLVVEGVAYETLLADLLADRRFAKFGLSPASELAPKEPGGLNIEGMTERFEGGVWIGFRNPVPNGRALLFQLLNPEAVVKGLKAELGPHKSLDLGGLGVRSLSSWNGQYLIVAGHYSDGAASRLFSWDGRERAVPYELPELGSFNPEAFYTPEGGTRFLLLSDDGSVVTEGVECKLQKDPAKKRFRGLWLATTPAP